MFTSYVQSVIVLLDTFIALLLVTGEEEGGRSVKHLIKISKHSHAGGA